MSKTLELPDKITPDLQYILGRVCFTCVHIAALLRKDGVEIDTKAEAEQAAVIFWLLGFYAGHGERWRDEASQALRLLTEKHIPAEAKAGNESH